MPDHLPLEAWDRRELLSELWKHQQAQRNLQREFDRRGERDEWKWGFPVFVHEKLASGAVALTTAYHIFDSAGEAYEGARKYAREHDQDEESAPYRVHKVYLPASVDTHPKGGDSTKIEAPAPLSGAVGAEGDETPNNGAPNV
jgi:hypothetical protein